MCNEALTGKNINYRIQSTALLISMLVIQPVFSQESEAEFSTSLEEVIVTATKRPLSIQEVPVSILAVNGDVLERNAINDLASLSRYLPNLIVGDGLLTTAVSIRGMGSQPERGFEQSVGMFIDGIYMPRSRQYRAPFLDSDRVEVLRGPQAVLFGLNSTAGAVSIITNRSQPGDVPVADVRGEFEFAQGGYKVTTVLGGSPSQSVGLRLAARGTKMDDYLLNDFTGKNEGGSDETVIRFSAVWEPTDTMRFDFKYEAGRFDVDGNLGEQFGPENLNQLLLLGLDGGDDGLLNWQRRMDASFMPILTSVFEIGEYVLTASLGISAMEYDLYTDLDASKLAIIDLGINEEFEQDSLELRWTSPGGNRFDYILGFYLHDSEVRNHQPMVFEPTTTLAPGAFGFDQVYTNGSYQSRSDLWSLFATGTFHISENWRLSAGVRYSDEDKDYQRQSQCVPVRAGEIDFHPDIVDQALFEQFASDFFCANLDGFSDNRSSGNWMPEIAVEWDLSDDIMWYGKYSQSAKSGGWVASTVVSLGLIAYDDERADSWELGMRSYLLNGRVALNLALYKSRFDDLQVNAFDPITFEAGVRNEAKATSQGIEIDGDWLISEWLTMHGAYAYLDSGYDSFADSPCPVSETLSGTTPPCDATGKRLPLSPKHSFSLGFDVNQQMSSGLLFVAGLNLAYTDDYFSDAALEPALIQSSFTTVGARIGLEAANGKWNLALVGTNLTNETILNNSSPAFNNIGIIQPPRLIWLQANWRFFGN